MASQIDQYKDGLPGQTEQEWNVHAIGAHLSLKLQIEASSADGFNLGFQTSLQDAPLPAPRMRLSMALVSLRFIRPYDTRGTPASQRVRKLDYTQQIYICRRAGWGVAALPGLGWGALVALLLLIGDSQDHRVSPPNCSSYSSRLEIIVQSSPKS